MDTLKSSNKHDLRSKNKKTLVQSSDSSDTDSSDEDYDYEEFDELEEEFDNDDFQRLLNKIFPSKYLSDKIKTSEKKALSPSHKKRKHSQKEESDTSGDEEEEEDILGTGKQNINLIFQLDSNALYGEDYDDEDEEWDTLEEEDTSDTDTDEEAIVEESEPNKKKKRVKTKKEEVEVEEEEEERKITKENIKEEKELLKTLQIQLKQQKKKNKNSSILESLEKLAHEQEKKIQKVEKKLEYKMRRKNELKLKKLIHEKEKVSDIGYFRKLDFNHQTKVLDAFKKINEHHKITIPYRFKIIELDIPDRLKICAMNKIDALKYMEPGAGEYYKIKNWVDTFMTIPFNKYDKLTITLDDGEAKCSKYMNNAINVLDSAVYGLNDAKMQIMQMIGMWISNPDAVGNAIAIKGPPGTGKTTLVKEGISKILDRPFEFIALGGSTDSSFLEGHSYTYEGSTWGKIVNILIKSKCMNPIIYFDELDKVSDTPKGEEIIGILTHLIDTSQNTQFHDKYFSEIDFDLSKCLFIFSYNDESKINPILRDRMYKIHTKGYDNKEKVVIAKDYLLPSVQQQINFKEEDIQISDDVISYIITNYTEEEKGVRNLKRCLEILHTKLNLYRLTTGLESTLFKEDVLEDVSFPYTVTKDIVAKLIIKNKENYFPTQLYI